MNMLKIFAIMTSGWIIVKKCYGEEVNGRFDYPHIASSYFGNKMANKESFDFDEFDNLKSSHLVFLMNLQYTLIYVDGASYFAEFRKKSADENVNKTEYIFKSEIDKVLATKIIKLWNDWLIMAKYNTVDGNFVEKNKQITTVYAASRADKNNIFEGFFLYSENNKNIFSHRMAEMMCKLNILISYKNYQHDENMDIPIPKNEIPDVILKIRNDIINEASLLQEEINEWQNHQKQD